MYLENTRREEEQKQLAKQGDEEEGEANDGLVGASYCAMLLGWLAHGVPTNARALGDSLRSSKVPVSSLASHLNLFFSFQFQAGILVEYPLSFCSPFRSFVDRCAQIQGNR